MPAQTLSVAILSGKGGVGKSNVTLNLALSLQQSGASVLVVDGDLGLANVDVLMGFTPDGTIWDVLQGRMTIDRVLHTDASGLHVLPAASGTGQQAQLDSKSCQLLLKTLRPLAERHDFVLLDLGAGLSETVRLLARSAAVQLVVTTPEPTAITDAYALLKVLGKAHHLDHFQVVINNVQDPEEVSLTRTRLLGAARKFLQVEARLIGTIRHDPLLQEAVCKRTPLLRLYPDCPAATDIAAIAKKLKSLRRKMIAEGSISPCLSLRTRKPAGAAAPATGASTAKTTATSAAKATAQKPPAQKSSADSGRKSATTRTSGTKSGTTPRGTASQKKQGF